MLNINENENEKTKLAKKSCDKRSKFSGKCCNFESGSIRSGI